MKKVVCARCGLVNRDTFPSFPFCEACGTRLPALRRFGWRERLRRPVLPLVWSAVLGAGVALVAFLSLSLARDTRDHNRGALAVTGQGVPDSRDPRAQEWTLTLQPSNEGDDEPLHHLRLRLSLQDEKLWRLRVIAPRPDSVESHGGGRYFGWSSLPARATVQLRLAAPRSVHQASSLKLMWTADGFEALPLLVRPFARRAATRTGSRWALAGIVPVNRSH